MPSLAGCLRNSSQLTPQQEELRLVQISILCDFYVFCRTHYGIVYLGSGLALRGRAARTGRSNKMKKALLIAGG
jgi:hypothetical protein